MFEFFTFLHYFIFSYFVEKKQRENLAKLREVFTCFVFYKTFYNIAKTLQVLP